MQQLNLEDSIHIIIHDLREPINNMLTLNQLFSKELKSITVNPKIDYHSMVGLSCHKALELINEILLTSQMEADMGGIKTSAINLNRLIENQLKLFNIEAQNKQIRLHCRLPVKEIYTLLDIVKFERCLKNLLSNALKFTPENGKITLTLTQNSDMGTITVSDTGIGIADEMIPHLFSKFSPASRKGLNGESSYGLGLFSAKHLIELHGGTIRVESKVGLGSSFFIDFPLSTKQH